MTHGFEGSNLRAIAGSANMSTGALFANFENKSDLFNAIIVEDYALLAAAMRAAPTHDGDGLRTLVAMLDRAYEFLWPQLPLVQALFSTNWTCERTLHQRRDAGLGPVLLALASALEAGKASGQLRADLPVTATSHHIWTVFAASFQGVIFADQDQASISTQMAETIDQMARGWRT